MIIRHLEPEDCCEYLSILSELVEVNKDLDHLWFTLHLMTNNIVVLGAFQKPMKMVGIGSLYFVQKLAYAKHKQWSARIEDVVVAKPQRGKGIGKEIVEKLVEIARNSDKKPYKVTLACSEKNVGFYESCGFHKHENEMRVDLI